PTTDLGRDEPFAVHDGAAVAHPHRYHRAAHADVAGLRVEPQLVELDWESQRHGRLEADLGRSRPRGGGIDSGDADHVDLLRSVPETPSTRSEIVVVVSAAVVR